MSWRVTDALIPASLALVGAALIAFWLQHASPRELVLRAPGMDQSASSTGGVASAAQAPVAGTPQVGSGTPSQVPGSWPWFRGPQLDGICRDTTPLLRSWPASGPPVQWSIELGEGYAGAAIDQGRVYVLDYDETAKADTLRCLSLDDGREIWHNSYPVEITRNHGISRTVPALTQGLVITLGPRCHVACWDALTGACRWLIDLTIEYGTEVPRWYAGQCPLIDNGRLILAPGGPKGLVCAIDIQTGKSIWVTPNPQLRKMTHASIVPMEFLGQRMYIYCASSAVVGVSADDGRQLWESTEWFEQFATSPSPVVLPEGRIFLSSGYGNKVGTLVLQLGPGPNGGLQAQKLFELTPKQFNSEQQTPILHDGYLYGIRKQGGGRIVCMDLSGKEIWNSDADRFGHGPYLISGDLLFALSNEGELVMAEASPSAYRALGRYQVFEGGRDAWGPMALAGGRLIVRDMTRMTCLNLSQSSSDAQQGSDGK